MIFARELKAWRKRAKLSQSQAAVKLGIPTKTLQNWEHGRNTPGALAQEALRATLRSKAKRGK